MERNSVCCIRFPFPYSVFYFALLSLYSYLLILFQFVLRPLIKNAKRRQMRLQSVRYRAQVTVFSFSFFYFRSFYNREQPQERERHKNHRFRLATLPVYHAF